MDARAAKARRRTDMDGSLPPSSPTPGLKVALVTTFYPPHNFGGDGIYVRRLAHALAALGCSVTVIYDKDAYETLAPPEKRNPAPLPEPSGVKVAALSGGMGPIGPLLTQQLGVPTLTRKRLEAALSKSFDVIHYHNISLVGGPGVLSLGGPAIRLYTAHEHWLVCPTHILWRNQKEICTGQKCFSCQLAYRRPPQYWRSTHLLEEQVKSIDAFIALSESSAENHRRFGFRRTMRVMPSFLPDIDPASADAPHPNEGRPYLFFAGRLEAIKGLQDVIPQFDDAMPADLLIAGDGEFGAQLRTLAAGKSKVKFLGRLPPDQLDAYYRNALALIAPSRCYEVFPLVALEAFRASTPMIARNLGSYPEIARKSGAGLLFDQPSEIRAMIERLINQTGLRADLGLAARRAFETRWSDRVSLASYFDLVGDLARTKGWERTAEKAEAVCEKLRVTR